MNEQLRQILPRVQKPARYTGGEYNSIVKDWESALVKMVFAFPDVYEVGMSHLGGRILYGLVNEHPDYLLERTFAPGRIWRNEGQRVPLYARSRRPVRDFDVRFSQYELSFTNVLNMLDRGYPVWSEQRSEQIW